MKLLMDSSVLYTIIIFTNLSIEAGSKLSHCFLVCPICTVLYKAVSPIKFESINETDPKMCPIHITITDLLWLCFPLLLFRRHVYNC